MRHTGQAGDAPRLRVLLLCDDRPDHAANVLDHIAAIRDLSRHRVTALNVRGRRVRLLDLREFDVVIVHWSLAIIVDSYVHPGLRRRIAEFEGLKIAYIQDEYRWVDRTCQALLDLGIDVLFTCTPQSTIPELYGPILGRVQVLPTLTGYVPDALVGTPVPPLRSRQVDVGYRSRKVPYWLGRLGYEKVRIAEQMLAVCEQHGLRADISCEESERLYGPAWARFLAGCRTTLGSESGASIVDRDGRVEAAVQSYLRRRPQASFDEVESEVLAPYEGNLIMGVVSPRIFEAAALRTALILYPGAYSGAVEPWRHFIPLEKDLSNAGEVVERIRDDAFLEELTERTYEEIVVSGRWSLRTMVAELDDAIDARGEARAGVLRPTAPATAALLETGRASRALAGRALDAWVVVAETMRRRDVRRLARALLGSPASWTHPASLLHELRSALLVNVVETGPTPFFEGAVRPVEVEDGEWLLKTVSPGERNGREGRDELRRRLASGGVRRIRWRPPAGSAVPTVSLCATLRNVPVRDTTGEGALLELLPASGSRVRAALADVLLPPAPGPRATRQFVVSSPLAWARCWAYALVVFSLALAFSPRVGVVVAAYLRRRARRAAIRPDAIAGDALWVALLRRIARSGRPPGIRQPAVHVGLETSEMNMTYVLAYEPPSGASVPARTGTAVHVRNLTGDDLCVRAGPLRWRVIERGIDVELEAFSALARMAGQRIENVLPPAVARTETLATRAAPRARADTAGTAR